MLISRVTTALVKFLAPVSSSNDSGMEFDKAAPQELPKDRSKEHIKAQLKISDQGKEEGASFDKRNPHNKGKLVLRLVENKAQSPIENLDDEILNKAYTGAPSGLSETAESSKFLQLFSLFQKQRSQFQQKTGNSSYQAASQQKRSGRFKKGSILDTHID